MYSRSKWTAALAVIVVLTGILSACAPAEPEVVEVTRVVTEKEEVEVTKVVKEEVEVTAVPEEEKKVFRFGRVAGAVNPDPVFTDANYDIWYMQQYYSGLLRFTKDLEVEGDLATGCEASEDGLTYTCQLREGITFSDGTPITAEDWEWSLNRARNPENGIWSFTLSAVESIEATDETVTFELSEPYAPFIYSLALFNAVVMPKAKVEEAGGWENFMNNPIGAGPFMMEEWKRGEYMRLAKNPNYWEADRINIDEIMLRNIPDDNARILAVQAGEVDAINYAPFNRVPDLQQDPNVNVTFFPGTAQQTINFNHRMDEFSDPRVRRALCLALDKDAFIETVNFGVGEVATTYLPHADQYHDPDLEGWPYDPEEAKRLMEEAGYADGFDIAFTTREGRQAYQQIATLTQSMWEPLNVNIEIQPLETGLYYDRYYNNEFESQINGWTNDVPDPSQKTGYYMDYSVAECVHSGWETPDDVKALIDEGVTTLDEERRQEIYSSLQQTYNEETIHCPLYEEPYLVVLGPAVRNFYQTPLGTYVWRDLDVSR